MPPDNGAYVKALARLPYKVERHVYVHPGTHVKVVLRCIGWPTHGLQPDVETRELDLLVPADDVEAWHLGRLVNLEVNAR